MDSIEQDLLYDERGEVSPTRPLLQGDVFSGVVLPGFGDEVRMVQIVAHPCAMRSGPDLAPRITVAPVEAYRRVSGRAWNGNLRVMPLEALIQSEHFAAKFVDVTACPADLLTRGNRVASLTNRGIYVLQQRLVKHYTRLELGLDVLKRESAPVLMEAELQWDWLDAVLTQDELDDDNIEAEATVFDAWLSDGDPRRRDLIRNEVDHADLRREAARAQKERALVRGGER